MSPTDTDPHPGSGRASLWRGRAAALIGITLLAFSLRSAVASLAPLIDHVDAEIGRPPSPWG